MRDKETFVGGGDFWGVLGGLGGVSWGGGLLEGEGMGYLELRR